MFICHNCISKDIKKSTRKCNLDGIAFGKNIDLQRGIRTMQILSFSAVEILPSLLNKSKTQTIRPLWKEPPKPPKAPNKEIEKQMNNVYKPLKRTTGLLLKKPRFKVGDKAKLIWKQRSKYKWFCPECKGNGTLTEKEMINHITSYHGITKNTPLYFNKILGIAKITEVFEIEMKTMDKDGDLQIIGFKDFKTVEKTWKLDGFKNSIEFYDWFDKKYDLSTPKRFAVYRWVWL